MDADEEVEEVSSSGDGLCEALNSLHTKDLLLDVFGVETKFSYEVMTEIISRIRERYSLKKEFMLAEESGDLDSLYQAINKKNNSITVTNKTPGQMLSDYCNRMVEIYLMKNRNDYISEAQQLTDNISRLFGLNDVFPPIIIKKLEPPIDCPYDMVQIITMKKSLEAYNERAR